MDKMEHVSENVDHLKENFWVVTVINNPCRFKKRIQLFREFTKRMNEYNVNLCVVEAVYGERKSEIKDIKADIKVSLKATTILWKKENLINIGISRLPQDWKYVAWIDSDIDFVRKDWVKETIHQLQIHHVVQMFEDIADLGPNGEIMKTSKSFMYCYKNDIPRITSNKKSGESHYYYQPSSKPSKGSYWHPGYCWAATRHAINTFGGLFELGIVGAGDHHMACSLIGEYQFSVPNELSEDYRGHLYIWQERALRLHKNVGYVNGTIFHYFHGKKVNRNYNGRWEVLLSNDYKPSFDIYKDSQGLLVFHEGKSKLRDDIIKYFNSRNEDSIDL